MSHDWKKIGARSRSRGRRFEKDVATQLGWSRVPFSGANAEYGEGDVIDGYVNGAGYWVAECKMRTGKESGTVTIEPEWVEQANKACERSGRWPVIIVGTKVDQRKPQGLVFLPEESMRFIQDRVAHASNRDQFLWASQPLDVTVIRTTSRKGGFSVRKSVFDRIAENVHWTPVQLFQVVTPFEEDGVAVWCMMTLDGFVALMRNLDNACVPGPNSGDDDD